jgi:ribose 5-phosphate isomerase B
LTHSESPHKVEIGALERPVCVSSPTTRGRLICGSGIGISIAANRHAHIRCALVHDVTGARLCRQHNDANVLAMGGRMIGEAAAKECVEVFLSTKFDGGRHQKRVDKLGSC